MSRAEFVADQAAAFLGLFDRRGGCWTCEFRRWAESKDFRPAVVAAIAAVVGMEIQARGTFSDPFAMLDYAPVED